MVLWDFIGFVWDLLGKPLENGGLIGCYNGFIGVLWDLPSGKRLITQLRKITMFNG